ARLLAAAPARRGTGAGGAAARRRPLRRDGRRRRRCAVAGAGGGMTSEQREHLQPPAGVRRDYPLARLATVRTGGEAQFFARAGSDRELAELLSWSSASGL